jgi:hypothetical protein
MVDGMFFSEVLMQVKIILRAADDLEASNARRLRSLSTATPNLPGEPRITAENFEAEMAPRIQRYSQSMRAASDAAEDIWMALQQMLVAAANASKLLWGSRGKKTAARAALRQAIGVSDSNPLEDPDLRNDWEHIDERIDTWAADDSNRVFLGRLIGNPQKVLGQILTDGQPAPPQSNFRSYDPDTGIVSFWEHSVSVPNIVREARAMLPRLQAVLVRR